MKNYFKRHSRDILLSTVVFFVSFTVRMLAASTSRLLEPDEITYIEAGTLYVSSIMSGDLFYPWWSNFEHPALAKYLIGISVIYLPLPTHIAARIPSVFLGSLTCVLTYCLGKVLFGEKVGMLGSVLLTFNVRSIIGSKEAMLEAPLTFFSILSLLLLYTSLQKNSRKLWVGSAIASGLAMASKFSAVFLVLVSLLYISLRREKREAAELGLLWLVVGGLVFYIIQPRYWLNPFGELLVSLGLYWRRARRGRWYDTYFMGETYDVAPAHYLLVVMIAELTPFETTSLITALSILLSRMIRRRWSKGTGFLVLTVIAPFLYLSFLPLKLTHYLVMCMPGVVLLAAYGASKICKATPKMRDYAIAFILSILLLVSIVSVMESYPSLFYYNPIIGKDTYTYLVGHPGGGVKETVAWIKENVPTDSRIAVIGYEEEFQQLDEERKYVRFNYRASLHYVRDVNKIRYLVVQISMAERIQNPLWKAAREMEPVFETNLRGIPTIFVYDFGPR